MNPFLIAAAVSVPWTLVLLALHVVQIVHWWERLPPFWAFLPDQILCACNLICPASYGPGDRFASDRVVCLTRGAGGAANRAHAGGGMRRTNARTLDPHALAPSAAPAIVVASGDGDAAADDSRQPLRTAANGSTAAPATTLPHTSSVAVSDSLAPYAPEIPRWRMYLLYLGAWINAFGTPYLLDLQNGLGLLPVEAIELLVGVLIGLFTVISGIWVQHSIRSHYNSLKPIHKGDRAAPNRRLSMLVVFGVLSLSWNVLGTAIGIVRNRYVYYISTKFVSAGVLWTQFGLALWFYMVLLRGVVKVLDRNQFLRNVERVNQLNANRVRAGTSGTAEFVLVPHTPTAAGTGGSGGGAIASPTLMAGAGIGVAAGSDSPPNLNLTVPGGRLIGRPPPSATATPLVPPNGAGGGATAAVAVATIPIDSATPILSSTTIAVPAASAAVAPHVPFTIVEDPVETAIRDGIHRFGTSLCVVFWGLLVLTTLWLYQFLYRMQSVEPDMHFRDATLNDPNEPIEFSFSPILATLPSAILSVIVARESWTPLRPGSCGVFASIWCCKSCVAAPAGSATSSGTGVASPLAAGKTGGAAKGMGVEPLYLAPLESRQPVAAAPAAAAAAAGGAYRTSPLLDANGRALFAAVNADTGAGGGGVSPQHRVMFGLGVNNMESPAHHNPGAMRPPNVASSVVESELTLPATAATLAFRDPRTGALPPPPVLALSPPESVNRGAGGAAMLASVRTLHPVPRHAPLSPGAGLNPLAPEVLSAEPPSVGPDRVEQHHNLHHRQPAARPTHSRGSFISSGTPGEADALIAANAEDSSLPPPPVPPMLGAPVSSGGHTGSAAAAENRTVAIVNPASGAIQITPLNGLPRNHVLRSAGVSAASAATASSAATPPLPPIRLSTGPPRLIPMPVPAATVSLAPPPPPPPPQPPAAVPALAPPVFVGVETPVSAPVPIVAYHNPALVLASPSMSITSGPTTDPY